MPRQYSYQYETSPRKIKPDYHVPSSKKKKNEIERKPKQTNKKPKVSKKDEIRKNKEKQKEINKAKFFIFLKSALLFGALFLIIFRNSQISESFSEIQKLKSQIAVIQKENDQLEISIQNNLNLQNIKQAAKEKLGMQELTSKQTVQISLPKKDYTEPRIESVVLENEENFVSKLIEKIKNIF